MPKPKKPKGPPAADAFLAQPPEQILAGLDRPVTAVEKKKAAAFRKRLEAHLEAVAAGLQVPPPADFRARRRVRVDEYRATALYEQVWADYHALEAAWEADFPRPSEKATREALHDIRRTATGSLRKALSRKFPDLEALEALDVLVQSAVEFESQNRVEVLREYVGNKLGVKKETVRDAVAAQRKRRAQWAIFLQWVRQEHPQRLAELASLTECLEQWRGQWPGPLPTDFYAICGPVLLDLIRHMEFATHLEAIAAPPSRVSVAWVAEQLRQLPPLAPEDLKTLQGLIAETSRPGRRRPDDPRSRLGDSQPPS
jgi:hypothetical protein